MSRLLHISASPRGAASVSLGIADLFLNAYAETHPNVEIDSFDLWDGTLPARQDDRFRRRAAGG
jgi:FMN-dependent NADH-azoreductase